jgi:hypothetical protein
VPVVVVGNRVQPVPAAHAEESGEAAQIDRIVLFIAAGAATAALLVLGVVAVLWKRDRQSG